MGSLRSMVVWGGVDVVEVVEVVGVDDWMLGA